MKLEFRTLKPSEIEVRVGSGGTLLLYKDARVAMALLDEVVGVGNWQREHKILGDDIYCKVSIYNKELGCWVGVEDAGSSGNIEVEKTKASDSFKRACVNLGIGRELYTAPKIKIPEQFKNSQFFDVKVIEYNQNREISKLVITTNFGKDVVYSYPKTTNYSQTAQKTTQTTRQYEKGTVEEITKGLGDTFDIDNVDDDGVMCSAETKSKIQEITGHYDADKFKRFKNYMEEQFGCSSIGELTESQGQQLLKVLGGK